jgi:sodium/bile acid cotransporter 7
MLRKFPIRIDPFLLWLGGTVLAATLLPARGAGATLFGYLADAAIVLLFFLHGAKLSREAILGGLSNLRLHGLVLASTYVLFPAIGILLTVFDRTWFNPLLGSGLLFLALLPSTVQSSIAFTAVARGNVAAAVCSASLSNLLGIFLTPLLVTMFMHGSGDSAGTGGTSTLDSIETIALQLLLPFLSGHLLRPWIGTWVDRHKKILMPVDRGSILLVVYTAFSAAVINHLWTRVSPADFGVLLVLCAVMLGLVMVANLAAARIAGLRREDAVVLFFCGSKKSLVSGVPMAGALFAPAQVGLVVLPLMVFHQLQLFLCAWMAERFRRQAEAEAQAPPELVRA